MASTQPMHQRRNMTTKPPGHYNRPPSHDTEQNNNGGQAQQQLAFTVPTFSNQQRMAGTAQLIRQFSGGPAGNPTINVPQGSQFVLSNPNAGFGGGPLYHIYPNNGQPGQSFMLNQQIPPQQAQASYQQQQTQMIPPGAGTYPVAVQRSYYAPGQYVTPQQYAPQPSVQPGSYMPYNTPYSQAPPNPMQFYTPTPPVQQQQSVANMPQPSPVPTPPQQPLPVSMAPVVSNTTMTMPPVSMSNQGMSHPPPSQRPHAKRTHVLAIVNPETKDIVNQTDVEESIKAKEEEGEDKKLSTTTIPDETELNGSVIIDQLTPTPDLPSESDFVHVSGRSSTEISVTEVEDPFRKDDSVSRTSAESAEPEIVENDKKDDQPFNVGAQMAMMVAQRVLNPTATNQEETSIAKVEDVKFGFFDETDVVNHTGVQSDEVVSEPQPQVDDVVDSTIEAEQPVTVPEVVQVSEPSPAPELSLVENEKPVLSDVSIPSDPPAGEIEVETLEQSIEDGEIIDEITSAGQQSVETTVAEDSSIGLTSEEALIKQWMDKEDSIREAAPDLWSPDNEQGLRVYDREFMMLISDKVKYIALKPEMAKEVEKSKGRVHPLSDVFGERKGPLEIDARKMSRGFQNNPQNFVPNWHGQGGGSMQGPPRGSMGGRPNAYTGRPSGGRNRNVGSRNSQQMIRPSITREDVKLRTTENAWKPTSRAEVSDSELAANANKVKTVRGLLNKITPNTFDDLMKDFFAMEIDVDAIGADVINTIFDKAVEEPHFCPLYSDLCKQEVSRDLETGGDNKSKFRNILLLRCQKVFEEESEEVKKEKQNAIDECQDETEKKRLSDAWAQHIQKGRRRMFGNIRFIGELFKKKLLVSSIIHYCVMTLIQRVQSEEAEKTKSNIDEEAVECMVKLLTSVGSLLHADQSTTRYNERSCDMLIKYCSWLEDHRETLSNRVKFSVEDLLELQKNDWVPRKEAEGPKKIEEIHQQAKKEKIEENIRVQQYELQKKDDRDRGGRGNRRQQGVTGRSSYDNRDRNMGNRQGQQQQQRQVNTQQSALTPSGPAPKPGSLSSHMVSKTDDVKLGPSRMGTKSSWARGAGGGQTAATPPVPPPQQASQAPRRRYGERGSLKKDDSRDSSQQPSREPSVGRPDSRERREAMQATRDIVTGFGQKQSPAQEERQTETPTSEDTSQPPTRPESTEPMPETTENKVTDEKRNQFSKYIVDELCINDNYEDIYEAVKEKASQTDPKDMFYVAIEHANDKSDKHRKCLGKLITRCTQDAGIRNNVIQGLQSYIEDAIEFGFSTDVPLIWSFVGQVLGSALATAKDHVPSLGDFRECFLSAAKGDKAVSAELLAFTLMQVREHQESGEHQLVQLWRDGNHEWSNFSPQLIEDSPELNRLLENNPKLKCLQVKPEPLPRGLPNARMIELERYLKDSLQEKHNSDQMVEWLAGHFPDNGVNEANFVPTLVKGICNAVIVGAEDDEHLTDELEVFENYVLLLHRFVTGDCDREVQALNAFCQYTLKIHYPEKLLFNLVNSLSGDLVLSTESLQKWYEQILASDSSSAMIKTDGSLRNFFKDLKDRGMAEVQNE